MLDPTGVVMTWNTGAARIKGYRAEEIIGRNFGCFYTPEDRARGKPREALETALREGKYEGEHLRVRKDGSHFWAHVVIDPLLEADGRLVGFVKMTRDVTEHVRAREELERTRQALVQSQKLEAVGQLAGGIAHDLNNILTTVIGNLDMFQRRARVEEAATRELLAAAMRGAESGASLVAKLLAFALRQIFSAGRNGPRQARGGLVVALTKRPRRGRRVEGRPRGWPLAHVSRPEPPGECPPQSRHQLSGCNARRRLGYD
jgi:PAS domain S-box-containing protein